MDACSSICKLEVPVVNLTPTPASSTSTFTATFSSSKSERSNYTSFDN
ncbi:MAG: hypothetical protein U9Q66_00065 [Patescibacteria group bacterium]|nr:hypothetical protein [Patescibacteria group bacterium]